MFKKVLQLAPLSLKQDSNNNKSKIDTFRSEYFAFCFLEHYEVYLYSNIFSDVSLHKGSRYIF